MKKKKKKEKCQSGGPICSGELLATYSVNGSAREGTTFVICGACCVYLRKGGAKLEQVAS